MIEFFLSGGPLMWYLLAAATIIAVQTVRSCLALWGSADINTGRVEQHLQGILFWAVFSGVFGVFGQFMGIYKALKAIIAAADVSPPIVLMGMKLSFHTTLFGLEIFIISSVVWYILRWQLNSRVKTG